MAPAWLTVLAWCALGAAFASTLWLLVDIFGRGFRQQMWIMEVVWPVTALYFGPAAVWAYRRWGRLNSRRWKSEHGRSPDQPGLATTAIGVSHCGAGCTLGDIIAESVVFALGLTVAGHAVFAAYIGDYVLALVLGIGFQYFAIAPMRGFGVRRGLVQAAKADFLSLTAFEVGLFGWMALMAFAFFPAPHDLHPDNAAYWFLMQIGMIIGFFTAWPVNTWLIRGESRKRCDACADVEQRLAEVQVNLLRHAHLIVHQDHSRVLVSRAASAAMAGLVRQVGAQQASRDGTSRHEGKVFILFGTGVPAWGSGRCAPGLSVGPIG